MNQSMANRIARLEQKAARRIRRSVYVPFSRPDPLPIDYEAAEYALLEMIVSSSQESLDLLIAAIPPGSVSEPDTATRAAMLARWTAAGWIAPDGSLRRRPMEQVEGASPGMRRYHHGTDAQVDEDS